jgi:hypothetical protein
MPSKLHEYAIDTLRKTVPELQTSGFRRAIIQLAGHQKYHCETETKEYQAKNGTDDCFVAWRERRCIGCKSKSECYNEAYGYYNDVGIRPDAFCVRAGEEGFAPTLVAYEVEVSNPIDDNKMNKYLNLWDLFDGDGCCSLELIVVDTWGNIIKVITDSELHERDNYRRRHD